MWKHKHECIKIVYYFIICLLDALSNNIILLNFHILINPCWERKRKGGFCFGHTAGSWTGPCCAVFQRRLQHRDRWHRLQSPHPQSRSVPLLSLMSCHSSLRQSPQLCSPARSGLTSSELYINQETPHFVLSGHTKPELSSHSMHTYQVESKGNEPMVFA